MLLHLVSHDGQGATDPQTVALGAYPYGENEVYTVAAILGDETVVVDYSNRTKNGMVVMRKGAIDGTPEMAVAVSSDGAVLAISNKNAVVQIFARSTNSSNSPDGKRGAFFLLRNIQPPNGNVSPASLSFSQGRPTNTDDGATSASTFLAVAWEDTNGAQVAVTGHTVMAGSGVVTDVWQYQRKCASQGSWDFVVPTGLAVSPAGEWVVLGSWGCSSSSTQPNVVVMQGKGGNGKPVMEHRLPGQVWAVAVNMQSTSRHASQLRGPEDATDKRAFVVAASWSTDNDQSVPAQLAVFATQSRQLVFK